MKRALFIVTSDLVQGGRAAEAIRVAAGVGGWQKVQVRVFLDHAPAKALADAARASIGDESILRQCLPMLGSDTSPILVAEEDLDGLREMDWETSFSGTNLKSLAALAANSDWVLHF